MIEQRKNDGESKAISAKRNYRIRAVCLVVVVIVIGVLIFCYRQLRRSERIEVQYSVAVAQMGHQLERKLRFYRNIKEKLIPQIADSYVTELLIKQFVDRALPSNTTSLEDCKNEQNTRQCLVENLLRMNGYHEKFVEAVTCEKKSQRMSLSSGRRSIQFHLSDDICGQFPISTLLPSLRSGNHPDSSLLGQLDDLLIFDRNGDGLVAQSATSTSNLRVGSLPQYDSGTPFNSRVVRGVEIQGEQYTLFIQPVRVDLIMPSAIGGSEPDGSEPSGLILCGFIKNSRIHNESLTVRPWWFLVVSLFLGVAMMAIPLSKLWWLGPESRFTNFDFILLVVSTFFFIVMCVVTVWSKVAYDTLEQRTETTLRTVGEKLSTQIFSYIENATEKLNDFVDTTGALRSSLVDSKSVFNKDECPTEPIYTPEQIDQLKSDLIGTGLFGQLNEDDITATGKNCYLFEAAGRKRHRTIFEVINKDKNDKEIKEAWHLAYWADKQGDQLLKISSVQNATAFFNINYRPYFKEPLACRNRCLVKTSLGPDCEKINRGYAQIVRSDTMGAIRLVVSRPTNESGDDEEACVSTDRKATGVASVGVPMDSTLDLLLPYAMTMAVVDKEGKVLLHSNNEAHHGHNIYNDVGGDNEADLRAILNAGVNATIDSEYLGKHVKMHVRYLSGPDWYLILQSPKSEIDGPVFHMMVFSIVMYGLHLVVVFGLVVIALMIYRMRTKRPIRIRPRADLENLYSGVGGLVWLFSFLVCTLLFYAPTLLRIAPFCFRIAFVLSPLVVPLFVVWPLCAAKTNTPSRTRAFVEHLGQLISRKIVRLFFHCRSGPATPSESCLSGSYFLWCWGLVGVLVFVPIVMTLTRAFDTVVQNRLQIEQLHYADAFEYEVLPKTCHPNTDICQTATKDDLKALQKLVAATDDIEISGVSQNSEIPLRHVFPLLTESLKLFGQRDGIGSLYRSLYITAKRSDKDGDNSWSRSNDKSKLQLALSRIPGRQGADKLGYTYYIRSDVPIFRTTKGIFWVTFSWLPALLLVGFAFRSVRRLFSLRRLVNYPSFNEFMTFLRKESTKKRFLLSNGSSEMAKALIAFESLSQRLIEVRNLYREGDDVESKLEKIREEIGSLTVPLASAKFNRSLSEDEHTILTTLQNMSEVLHPGNKLDQLAEVLSESENLFCPNDGHVTFVWIDRGDSVHHFSHQVKAVETGNVIVAICQVNPLFDTTDQVRNRWAETLKEYTVVELKPWVICKDEEKDIPNEATMRYLWNSCNPNEKKLLGKMTLDGIPLPHPKLSGTIRGLVGKGMLSANTLDFFHYKFKKFVGNQITLDDIKKWEVTDEKSTWNLIKAPLTTAVILFFTAVSAGFGSPELAATGAAAPTAAFSLPVIIKMLTSLSNRSVD